MKEQYREVKDLHSEVRARNLHPLVSIYNPTGDKVQYIDISTGEPVNESDAIGMLEGQLKAHEDILAIKKQIGFIAK